MNGSEEMAVHFYRSANRDPRDTPIRINGRMNKPTSFRGDVDYGLGARLTSVEIGLALVRYCTNR
jgi:hypothetical protein